MCMFFQAFKEQVHPKHVDIQGLNQTAADLIKDSPTEQTHVIRVPMTDVNKRWDGLLEGIAERKVCEIKCKHSIHIILSLSV